MTEVHVRIAKLVVTGSGLAAADADQLRAETGAAIAELVTAEAARWSLDGGSVRLRTVRAGADPVPVSSRRQVARGVARATTRTIAGAVGGDR